MADNEILVKAGKLFVFSKGEYSDYGYEGMFLALQDITKELFQSVVDNIKKQIASKKGLKYDEFTIMTNKSEAYEIQYAIKDFFIPYLIRSGAVVVIDYENIHLGSYGRLEIPGVET